jgi:hypothetical protein
MLDERYVFWRPKALYVFGPPEGVFILQGWGPGCEMIHGLSPDLGCAEVVRISFFPCFINLEYYGGFERG